MNKEILKHLLIHDKMIINLQKIKRQWKLYWKINPVDEFWILHKELTISMIFTTIVQRYYPSNGYTGLLVQSLQTSREENFKQCPSRQNNG